MNKAKSEGRRQRARHQLGLVRQHLQRGNIIVEVRDARAPRLTDPARLVAMPEHKVRVVVLAKADLADPATTRAWLAALAADGHLALAVDQRDAVGAGRALKKLMKEAVGRSRSALGVGRAIVVGVPNTGKSTLINRVLGRSKMRAGDRPGVTKGETWCTVDETLHLLDTPGVIEAASRLVHAAGEAGWRLLVLRIVPEGAVEPVEAALRLLAARGKAMGLPADGDPADPEPWLDRLAMAWNRLGPDGVPDRFAAASRLLRETSQGGFGRMSFEHPDDPPDPTDAPDPGADPEPAGGA